MPTSRVAAYDSLDLFPGSPAGQNGHAGEGCAEWNRSGAGCGRRVYEDLVMKITSQSSLQFAEMPRSLTCPISLDLMSDPVIVLETGQTYERQSILKWFKDGKSSCPVTKKQLRSKEIVANPAMKDAVEDWRRTMGWRLRIPKGGAPGFRRAASLQLGSPSHQCRSQFSAVSFPNFELGTALECSPCAGSHATRQNSALSGLCSPSSSTGAVATSAQQEVKMMQPAADNMLLGLNGWTHLHWAAAVDAVEMAQALAQNEAIMLNKTTAEIRYKGKIVDAGASPLHICAIFGCERVAKVLLLARSDVNSQDSSGNTPLHLAVFDGHLGLVEVLLRNGANKQLRNFAGQLPDEYANILYKFIDSDSNLSPLDEFRMQEALHSRFPLQGNEPPISSL